MVDFKAFFAEAFRARKPSISRAKNPLLIWAAYLAVMLVLVATLYKQNVWCDGRERLTWIDQPIARAGAKSRFL